MLTVLGIASLVVNLSKLFSVSTSIACLLSSNSVLHPASNSSSTKAFSITMKLSLILSGLYAAGFVTAITKTCQPFTLNSKATACTNDAGACIMGSCKDRFLWLRCTCPDDHPHVGCTSTCG
ncbi:hypothetical protein GQ607_005999 [Colletotrichum asianum]|uniref:Uncharacterized protein n=1 Tax=Colletotrichum asianum TaxID=702518 RepID=A0A8H3WGR7_9PEZI|nr:hypothetical protein GQ607_005999 [Colletotrichum asianum]